MNAYEVIDLSGIADSGQDYECTSVNDRLSGGSAACLFCQSGRWKAQRPSKVVQVVSTDISCAGPSDITISAGVYSANAYCPTNTTLVGGGFKLLNGAERSPYKPYSGVQGTNSPDYSMPVNQTTWSVAAGGYPDFCFTAIALCAE